MEKKWYYIGGGLMLVAIMYLVFMDTVNGWFKKRKEEKEKEKDNPTSQVGLKPLLNLDALLKKGVIGYKEEVKELQRILGGIVVDGYFGDKTQTSLMMQKQVSQITLRSFSKYGISSGEDLRKEPPKFYETVKEGCFDAYSTSSNSTEKIPKIQEYTKEMASDLSSGGRKEYQQVVYPRFDEL
jgi:hypothetical protein